MHRRENQQHSSVTMSDAGLFSKSYIWLPQHAPPRTSCCWCPRKWKESCCSRDPAHSLVDLLPCFTTELSESPWLLPDSYSCFRCFFFYGTEIWCSLILFASRCPRPRLAHAKRSVQSWCVCEEWEAAAGNRDFQPTSSVGPMWVRLAEGGRPPAYRMFHLAVYLSLHGSPFRSRLHTPYRCVLTGLAPVHSWN